MPNKFKYNKTGTEANSLFKGKWAIDTTPANSGGGPSSITGFYNGGDIPLGGYAIYGSAGVFIANNDEELLGGINKLGANMGSASEALTWIAGQTDYVVLNKSFDNIVTNGLVLNLDANHVSSFVDSEPTINLIPSPGINAYPTYGNGWGTYNTNQYCGNNGCAVHWDIPAIASVSNNIITTVSAHQIRSFDVINPLTTGGGVNGGQQYLAKKISNTQFSLHDYNGSQDGSQGYLNPTTGRFKVHDSFYLDQRVAVNASSFPTKWFGNPHQPNSALVKEVISGGFNVAGHPVTDCIRLHWFRSDATDGMAYGVDAPLTIGIPTTVSFWARAASASAVGQSISFSNYNYSGPAGYSYFGMGVSWGAHGVWVRNSYTFTPTHNAIISYWFPSTGDMKVDIANIQVEQSTGLTPFIAGSRSQNTNWYDLSGNNNNATLINGVVTDLNNNLSFDGIDDYVTTGKLPSELGMYDSSYTAEALVYPTDLSGDKAIFGTDQTAYRSGLHLTLRSGQIYLGHYSADMGGGYADINTWNHIVYRYDAVTGNGSTFKNGVLQNSAPIASFIGTTHVHIGREFGAYNFAGKIAVAKIYNRALSPNEILQNFNAQRNRFGI